MKQDKFELLARLQGLGFDYEQATQLRRISRTLRRWFEMECGDANGNCIERDETTGKPFCTFERGNGERGRYPVRDREAGAMRRLLSIMAPFKGKLIHYIQGDCRGASLYILKTQDIRDGESLDSVYSRGIAVY